MNNQLATYNTPLTMEPTPVVNPLMAQAEMMASAMKIAEAMCGTELVPKHYRGKPHDGAAAIMYGNELGLNAIQSLQQVMVINGKPSVEARAAVGLLIRNGCRFETVESSPEQVTVRGTRPATGADETVTWTMKRAQTAGYTKNALYKSIPEQMLYAKAAMEVARKIAPDVLMGIAYSSEELRLEPMQVEATRLDEQQPEQKPKTPAATNTATQVSNALLGAPKLDIDSYVQALDAAATEEELVSVLPSHELLENQPEAEEAIRSAYQRNMQRLRG